MKTSVSAFYCILLMAGIILVSSCERAEKNNKKELKVSRIILKSEADPYDSVIYLFDYSIANQISITNTDFYTSTTIYKFDAQNRLTEISGMDAQNVLFDQKVFTYTASTATIVYTFYYLSKAFVVDSTVFNLMADGYPSNSTRYNSSTGGMKYSETNEFTWQNGDLYLFRMFDEADSDTLSMSFDNKINPLNFTKIPVSILDYNTGDVFFFACSSHNFLQMTQGQEEFLKVESISYKSDNYPDRIIFKTYDQKYLKYHFEYIEK